MAVLRFLLALAAVALLHFLGTGMWARFPLAVDLFLVLAVMVGREGRPLPAMFAGMFAGWAADALSGGPFGLHGLADCAVAFGTALVAQQLVVQRRSSLAAIFAAAAAVQGLLLTLLAWVFLPGQESPSPVWLAVRAGSTALLGLAWTALAGAFGRRVSARRRRRASGTLNLPR
ncbi:MAG: rod shape-determining protein MreD [Thermoanaerobaculia bacterium]|jgi:rod shape-determining protein MreD|nr:MAG: rod shape-determining protein MreD [Thermoanaerobaculia bacterium]